MDSISTHSDPSGHNTTTSRLAQAPETRRPTVSQSEWLALSRAERIQRYSTDDTRLSAHPALSSVRDTAPAKRRESINPVLASHVEHTAVYDSGYPQRDDSLESESLAQPPPPADPPVASAQQEAALAEHTLSQKEDRPKYSNTDTELSAAQTSSPDRGSTHSSSPDNEQDYTARAANVRKALDKHIREERLLKRQSLIQPRDSSSDSKQARSQISRFLAERRNSVASLLSLGKTTSWIPSQILPTAHEEIAAGKENMGQRSPQKTRIGHLRRKPVAGNVGSVSGVSEMVDESAVAARPGSKSMLQAVHERENWTGTDPPLQQYRKALGLVSSSEQQTQDMLSRTKMKAANIRAKVKKTIEVWRGDAV